MNKCIRFHISFPIYLVQRRGVRECMCALFIFRIQRAIENVTGACDFRAWFRENEKDGNRVCTHAGGQCHQTQPKRCFPAAIYLAVDVQTSMPAIRYSVSAERYEENQRNTAPVACNDGRPVSPRGGSRCPRLIDLFQQSRSDIMTCHVCRLAPGGTLCPQRSLLTARQRRAEHDLKHGPRTHATDPSLRLHRGFTGPGGWTTSVANEGTGG